MDQSSVTRTHRRTRSALAAVALAAILAACGAAPAATTAPSASPSPAAATPASIESLVAQAKNEKGVVMYGNAPASYFKPIVDGFKATYPGISVEYTSLDDNTVFSKYQSEQAQGARTADILLASAPALWIQALANGVVAKVTPQGLSKFPSYATQAPGLYVMSPEPLLSTYNTKLLSAASAPDSYAKLAAAVKAEPSKYPLASYPIDNQLGYSAVYGLIQVIGWDQFWSIQDVLAPNTKTYSEGLTALQQVAAGAAVYGYNGSGLGQVVVGAATKGLVEYLFMKDATPLIPRAIAVTSGAASPASALLVLNYVFSDAGQQTLCAAGFEAYQNNFVPANNCRAFLGGLEKQVPSKNIYLVPITKDVLDQQSKIVQRWNQSYKR
jgi:iron(III) transport system substrate-binding protein